MGDNSMPSKMTNMPAHMAAALQENEITHFPQLVDSLSSDVKKRGSCSASWADENCHVVRLCTEHNVTTKTIFKATWALVLGRYTGGESIGYCCLQRKQERYSANLEWAAIDERVRVGDFLERIEANEETISTARQYFLADIEHALMKEGKLSALNSFLVAQEAGDEGWKDIVAPERLESCLAVRFQSSGKNYSFVLDFPTSVIATKHAENLANSLAHVFTTIVQNPQILIGNVDFVSQKDRDQIYQWNGKWPDMASECAHELIIRATARQPNALAIVSPNGDFTYKQMDKLSTQLSHFLRTIGVGPEVIVPLCFEKSPWAVISMVAVMKAGGVVVFLDPDHPLGRRQEILKQIRATNILVSEATSSIWGEPTKLNIRTITREFVEFLTPHTEIPTSNVSSSNAMYVVFTSGSTGKPKGCIVEHRSFCTAAKIHMEKSRMNSSSRVSQFASYTFDVSILEIVTGLMAGACVCLPSPESMSRGLANVINEYQISWSFLTPSLVRLMTPKDVPTLSTLVLGGEPLTNLEVESWADYVLLINGYGPSECSIAAAANPRVSRRDDPANIGYGIGGLCWIVDSGNDQKLVPVGVTGELLIQGPILARGYLENAEKTAEVFIKDPAWIQDASYSGKVHRFYKTGDLARYNADGSIHFVGRKDTQVKLRGQRIELGEIEHHLAAQKIVNLALVTMPKVGPCAQKLVSVLSLSSSVAQTSVEDNLHILSNEHGVSQDITQVKARLESLLPFYMIPTVWVVVNTIPLMVSGKMNRMKVSRWVNEMNEETYHKIMGVRTDEVDETPATELQLLLQQTYSNVLNLKRNQVALDKSFLSLGGDSISAMQVISRCQEAGYAVSIQDILRSKSIKDLTYKMRAVQEPVYTAVETFDTAFDLSPTQQMYFQTTSASGASKHYNQSFFLKMKENVPTELLDLAIRALIKRHSALRTYFEPNDAGGWSQFTTKDVVENMLMFSTHEIDQIQDAEPFIKMAHTAIDYREGPIFAARIFRTKDEESYLLLVAHHLVVDLVSWRIIIQDLEILLKGKTLRMPGITWQSWLKLQDDYAVEHLFPDNVLPFEVPSSDFEYWGMTGVSNLAKDTIEEIVSLSKEETLRLFDSRTHSALQTEPIDLLLGSVIHAFMMAFEDRQAPVVFREGHGREPWTSQIDLSRTVGWFTTMYPFYVGDVGVEDMIDIIRKSKDTRYSIPSNGWQYFASRFLNQHGKETFSSHNQVEITFDYLGLYQQLERDDGLFSLVPREKGASYDVGADVERFMLVELTAEMVEGRMQYQFLYNKHMKHGEKIRHWISQSMDSLRQAINALSTTHKQFTRSDFPLLSFSYDELDNLTENQLPLYGVSLENIEDIYPCTPMQRGLLLSQLKTSGAYEYYHEMEILPLTPGDSIDIITLQKSWNQVVSRHPILRTVFIESPQPERVYDQVVLKQIDAWVDNFEISSEDYTMVFAQQPPVIAHIGQTPHRFSICKTLSGRVFCRLDMNHAIADGASLPIIMGDLTAAYTSDLTGVGAPFSDYVSHIHETPTDSKLDYWTEYLADLRPCHLTLGTAQEPVVENSWETTEVNLNIDIQRLQYVCEQYGVTISNVLQTGWALVLQYYTRQQDVAFGYLSSGRDSHVAVSDSAVGPYLTMLISRQNLEGKEKVSSMLEKTRDDFTRSVPNQFFSLADVQHALQLSDTPLFNTVFSLQRVQDLSATSSRDFGIKVNLLRQHDPTEVRILS
ncbi:hypothetical protein PVAG01_06949 [Phlyctema vagabunda]|uniref:Carrier domain-containing protein n=1 Tax=Phlyctema vagabunda TaxID=108571 RepID=A0ABR4PB05_9HELO